MWIELKVWINSQISAKQYLNWAADKLRASIFNLLQNLCRYEISNEGYRGWWSIMLLLSADLTG